MASTVSYDYDVIIVGAGIAGASLGSALGNLGYRTLLLERDLTEPDRIVGELLQPGGVLQLRDLGLEDCLEGIDSIEVNGYGVFYHGEGQKLTYPKYQGKTVLGRSFHHGRFVQKLREAAMKAPNVTAVQGTAYKLLEDEGGVVGVSYREQDVSKDIYAPLTVVVDGCYSNFRSKIGAGKPELKSYFVGVILEDCKLPYVNHGNVFLASPGPVLGYQIGSNEVRILVDIPEPLPSTANGELRDFLVHSTAPQLPVEIRDSFLKAIDGGKIRSMGNSILHAKEDIQKPGLFAFGDTWNMRHPLTGGGMTVALADVVHVKNVLKEHRNLFDRETTNIKLRQIYETRKPLASTVNILAVALHSVFAAPVKEDPTLPYIQQACWNYFKLGGAAVSGPMSLLSGLRPEPAVLLTHFFGVALYGAVRSIWPPWPSNILLSYRILRAGSWIVIPLMKGEKVFGFFRTLLTILFWKSSKKPTN